MSTSKLINNIEALSITLSEKQLVQFLDIMDAMTLMVDKAKTKSKKLTVEAGVPQMHVPADCKYLH